MAVKSSESRVEKYAQRVDECDKARKKTFFFVAFFIAIEFIAYIVAITLSYQDESIKEEPAFWGILLGVTVVSLVGLIISWRKHTAAKDNYREAVTKFGMLLNSSKVKKEN